MQRPGVKAMLPGIASLTLGIGSALLLGGCAKISSPVGGEIDREPPRVLATFPEPLAVVEGLDRPVVIKFDERISEKQVRDAVLVSPETGAVRVKKGRSELRVSVEGGWRPGQIYRVVVLPVLQDLFNNPLKEEIELIFSTGPEIPATAVAGLLTDRLTAKPVTGARVEAISKADSVVYVALSDTAGFFALRHIPAGGYDLRAYLDRNRNRKSDYGEPIATTELALGAADTIISSYALLPADTTPARVVRAEARDSMQVRITLDDYLDPEVALDGVQVELRELPDSIVVPGVVRVAHVHEFERERAAQRAAADSVAQAAADSVTAADLAEAVADSAQAVADSAASVDSAVSAVDSAVAVAADRRAALDSARVVAMAKERAAAPKEAPARAEKAVAGSEVETGSEAAMDTVTPLPTRELVVVPAAPLVPKVRYLITISGIRNINGVEEGGGSAPFELAPSAPPDSTGAGPMDSTATVPPDSAGSASPDSVRAIPPDSVGGFRPDPTATVPPDSAATVPRDSTGVGPPARSRAAPPRRAGSRR